ncbi:hypothetical protein [Kaistia granuli]|uniref:hypothetical protein n=1 Tax=Kaistia granuli TaxID=363259 RepID=UPI0003A9D2CC|nr:hypothetical protein [Kaistia granuli]
MSNKTKTHRPKPPPHVTTRQAALERNQHDGHRPALGRSTAPQPGGGTHNSREIRAPPVRETIPRRIFNETLRAGNTGVAGRKAAGNASSKTRRHKPTPKQTRRHQAYKEKPPHKSIQNVNDRPRGKISIENMKTTPEPRIQRQHSPRVKTKAKTEPTKTLEKPTATTPTENNNDTNHA